MGHRYRAAVPNLCFWQDLVPCQMGCPIRTDAGRYVQLIAVDGERKARSYGFSIFAWFFFVLLYDLLVIGGTTLLNGSTANAFLFLSLFGNPLGMVRVSSLMILDSPSLFGAAGAALLRFVGGPEAALAILLCALAVWIIIPLLLSHRLLTRRDL